MLKETVWVHSIIDWTSILCIQVGNNSMGDFRHFMTAPFAGNVHQGLRWEQAFRKMLNSFKNSKETVPQILKKSVILKCH